MPSRLTELQQKELLKQKLEKEIVDLQRKRKDLDFVIKYEEKLASYESAKREAQQKYKKALKKTDALRSEIDLILDVDKFKPKNVFIQPKSNKGKAVGIANLITSDWHVEQRVDPDEVDGKNRFNPQIAEVRVQRFFEKGLRLVEIERSATKINTLVLGILGDLVSGYIHEDLMSTNFKTPPEAIVFCEELLYSGINYLIKNGKFDKIHIICQPGNHSRITPKRHHTKGAAKTLEWILFHNLAKTYERLNEHRVEFIIPKGYKYIHKEFDFPIRFCHGTFFKYNKGVGGATVSINRTLLRWNKSQPAYLNVHGHLHQYDPTRSYIQNGSLIGYTSMAAEEGYEYDEPKQTFFLIEKRYGLVVNRPIYLEVKC
jgi:hypothetical protein